MLPTGCNKGWERSTAKEGEELPSCWWDPPLQRKRRTPELWNNNYFSFMGQQCQVETMASLCRQCPCSNREAPVIAGSSQLLLHSTSQLVITLRIWSLTKQRCGATLCSASRRKCSHHSQVWESGKLQGTNFRTSSSQYTATVVGLTHWMRWFSVMPVMRGSILSVYAYKLPLMMTGFVLIVLIRHNCTLPTTWPCII